MTTVDNNAPSVWRESPALWISLGLVALLVGVTFRDGLAELWKQWGLKEEFSYAYLIPILVTFLVWQKKNVLESLPFTGSWMGVLVVVLGVILFIIGDLSTIYAIVQYSFVIVVIGIALALTGPAGFRQIWIPLLLLLSMVPLPQFFLTAISQQLQILSSELGVAFIRLFGIGVFLEGNVIDLGSMKLQVVEACSGLRYLFPLLTLGFIAAYFFKAPPWKRATVVLSTIPITVLMNSLRIGIIGILVEYFGSAQAEGFLHDFEGWIVFMACTAVLVVEMWLLNRLTPNHLPWREAFGLELPAPTPQDVEVRYRSIPKPYVGALVVLLAGGLLSLALPHRVEATLSRQDLANFPLKVGSWEGIGDRLEQIYLNELKLDDYLLVNYVGPSNQLVNLYIAYHGSQRKGESAHSPRTCIPGGGWRIKDFNTIVIERSSPGLDFHVNRAVIQHGEQQQLAYYWFQQRGRVITNEYLVKWFIFWDALTRNRTDGALVRLITPLVEGESVRNADERLASFARHLATALPEFVPD